MKKKSFWNSISIFYCLSGLSPELSEHPRRDCSDYWAGSPSCLRGVSSEGPGGCAGPGRSFSRVVSHTDNSSLRRTSCFFLWEAPRSKKSEMMTYNFFEGKYVQARRKIHEQAFQLRGLLGPLPLSTLWTRVPAHASAHTCAKHTQNTCKYRMQNTHA